MKLYSGLIIAKNHLLYLVKRAQRRKGLVTNRYGVSFMIDESSSLDSYVKKYGVLDDWVLLERLGSELPRSSVVFDIGANVGHMSFMFAKCFAPDGVTYAYEPDPYNVINFNKNLELNSSANVVLLEKALQGHNDVSQMDLTIRRAVDGSGFENRGISSLKKISKFSKESVSVKVSTLDKEVDDLGLSRVDFIKIDVEGLEYEVLLGGEKTITKFKPFIQYEYSNVLDALAGDDNTVKTFNFLKNLGYRQFYLGRDSSLVLLSEPDTSLGDMNLLCVPPDRLPFTGNL